MHRLSLTLLAHITDGPVESLYPHYSGLGLIFLSNGCYALKLASLTGNLPSCFGFRLHFSLAMRALLACEWVGQGAPKGTSFSFVGSRCRKGVVKAKPEEWVQPGLPHNLARPDL